VDCTWIFSYAGCPRSGPRKIAFTGKKRRRSGYADGSSLTTALPEEGNREVHSEKEKRERERERERERKRQKEREKERESREEEREGREKRSREWTARERAIDEDGQKQRRRDGEICALGPRGTLIRNNNNCRETRIMNVAAATAAVRSSTFAAVNGEVT